MVGAGVAAARGWSLVPLLCRVSRGTGPDHPLIEIVSKWCMDRSSDMPHGLGVPYNAHRLTPIATARCN
jgi:hypothetical protein